ncbi:diguanylate cyclase [Niveibacterium sp. SC-1]|uniref:diguanylate cyclase domain-containing protein n=1 Tax=Niveibacterium sp. SC-1 TaxID=3135646 RepID=UPI00311F5759
MRLRTQFLALLAVAIALAGIAIVVLISAARQEDAAEADQSRAQETAHEVSGLLILTQEYARFSEPRAAIQWRARIRKVTVTLEEATETARPVAVTHELIAIARALPATFEHLESIAERRDDFSMRRRDLLLDQVLTSTQAMSDQAYQWYGDASKRRIAATRRFQAMAFLTAGCLLVLLVFAAVVTRQRIIVPLQRLEEAAVALGQGDMSVRLASPSVDEFGRLSRQFDRMADALGANEARLKRSEQQLRAIADNLPVLISHIDQEEKVLFANATYRYWLGVDPQAIAGRSIREVADEALFAPRAAQMARALGGERVSFEAELTVGGNTRYTHSVYVPDTNEAGEVVGVYAMTSDITEQKRVEMQLQNLIRIDTLTGLPNRMCFNERMQEALLRARRNAAAMAVLYLDIDHFKSINDSLGHAAGDEVLRQFATRLQACVRRTDMVARIAGDEFVAILEGPGSPAEATAVAEKIVQRVREPLQLPTGPLAISTSVGVAYALPRRVEVDAERDAEALLEAADRALYLAKGAGRDGYRAVELG